LALATNGIAPRDASGNLDTRNGKIVLLSIGMSNTSQEWASKGQENFRALAEADPARNPQLVIVDGAQGGQASTDWTNFPHRTWSNVLQRLQNSGATTNQVQVIWMKHARRQPLASGAFPAHARALQGDLETILRLAQRQFPHLKIAYVSSRTRSYEDNPGALNPEPFAFEGGFATQWLIEKQLGGAAELNFDPARGPVVAPLILWGPYLWADGTVGRSDGFVWLCSDLESDFTHPSATGGVPKVARQLLAFFKTHPTATPWFLRQPGTNAPPTCVAFADTTNGATPLTVHFTVAFSGSVTQAVWTFDDGEFAFGLNPTKIFYTPGEYTVRVTVTDTNGGTAQSSLPITVRTTFEAWRADKFTFAELANEAVSGAAANPDGDPFPNLLEYALHLEPKATDPAHCVALALTNGILTLRLPHFKPASDVTLTLEASSDLVAWESLPLTPVADEGNVEILEAAVSVAGPPQRYFRLRAASTGTNANTRT
jgi:PKD repeat protein